MAEWRLNCVGTGSLISATYRAFPATLLDTSGFSVLVDCGDGTVHRLRSLGNPAIDVVALTSVSVSEIGGLLTFAEEYRRSRHRQLRLFAPPGAARTLEPLVSIFSQALGDLFELDEAVPGRTLYEQAGVHLEAVEVDAGDDPACAYLIYEAPLPGRVDAVKAARLGIKGSDFGRLQKGDTVRGVRPSDVIGPMRLGRRVLIAGRGRSTDDLEANLAGSDVGVFAAPFMDERLEVAEDSHYFTGWEAAALASRARVRLVLLQQLGPYAPTWHQVQEARQFHAKLYAPDDGDVVRIPLPDNGPPSLERSSRSRR